MQEIQECNATTTAAGPAEHHGLAAVTAACLRDVSALRDDWLGLGGRCGFISPWPHPDRYCAELRVSPGGVDPLVVLLRDKTGPRAMIIGRTHATRLACPVGYLKFGTPRVRLLNIVHGGLISDGSPAVRRGIMDHLQQLLHERQVDMISINHLPRQDALYEDLLTAGAVPQASEPHWRFTVVPGSYEQTLSVFSGKHKREMRRMERVLGERFGGQVSLRRFERLEELEELTRGCAAIATQTYQAGLGAGFSGAEPWREILTTEARQGRLRAYWLECGGQPIAFQIGAVYEKVYFMDFMGYLPQYASLGPGSVLHGRVIQDLCQDRVCGVDYGFGHAEYKKTYGTDSREEASLLLPGHSWRARTASNMLSRTAAASRVASQCLERLGLKEGIKKFWRRRLRAKPLAGHREGTGE